MGEADEAKAGIAVYVTDTHPLIFYVQQKLTRLGRDAQRIFRDADDGGALIYVPTVVLWEITRRLAEGQLVFPGPFDQWCRGLERATGYSIAVLDWPAVSEARRFPFNDPFDCLIAGTAANLGMPLITKDADMRDSGLIETVW